MLDRTASSWPLPDDDFILREAAHWVRKVEANGLSPREKRDLKSWLETDPRHASALELTMRAWKESPELLSGLGYDTSSTPRQSYAKKNWRAAAATFAAASAAVLFFSFMFNSPEGTFTAAETGDAQESIELADGSTMALMPDSSVEYLIEDGRREVRLLGGRADFNVKQAAAPFSVRSDDLTVVVVGTVFTVEHEQGLTEVFLQEGEISLTVSGRRRATLRAGDSARFLRSEGILRISRAVTRSDSEQRAERMAGGAERLNSTASDTRRRSSTTATSLSFVDERLDLVVAQLELEAGLSISLSSRDLADAQITGNVSIDDPVRSLRRVLERHDLVLEEGASKLFVRPRK